MFVEILEKYNKKDNWWLWLLIFCSAVWRFMILLSGCARVDWSARLLYNLYISEHGLKCTCIHSERLSAILFFCKSHAQYYSYYILYFNDVIMFSLNSIPSHFPLRKDIKFSVHCLGLTSLSLYIIR